MWVNALARFASKISLFFLKLLKCKQWRTSVTFFSICWKSGCWKENSFNNELGFFWKVYFSNFFVDVDNCLKLLPITVRFCIGMEWKVGLKNWSESLLEWTETSIFKDLSLGQALWALQWHIWKKSSKSGKKMWSMFLFVFFSSSGTSTSPASLSFFCRLPKRSACSCRLLCRWLNSVSVCLLFCSSSVVGFFFFFWSLWKLK